MGSSISAEFVIDNIALEILCKSHETQVHKEEKVKGQLADEINASGLEKTIDESEREMLRAEISKRMNKFEDTNLGSMWECTECGKQMKKKDKVELHIETHLEGLTNACGLCDKSHKTRRAVQRHISISHSEK